VGRLPPRPPQLVVGLLPLQPPFFLGLVSQIRRPFSSFQTVLMLPSSWESFLCPVPCAFLELLPPPEHCQSFSLLSLKGYRLPLRFSHSFPTFRLSSPPVDLFPLRYPWIIISFNPLASFMFDSLASRIFASFSFFQPLRILLCFFRFLLPSLPAVSPVVLDHLLAPVIGSASTSRRYMVP